MSARKALAVVAGAGPGTGAAIARTFAAQGYHVALLARTATHINSLAEEIKSAGGDAHAFPTDLYSPSQVADTFKSIKSLGLPLKVAIFNINTKWTVKPFLDLKRDEYLGIATGHMGAAFTFAQEALKEMAPAGEGSYDGTTHGTLIFTGATASLRGSAKFAALASACWGVRALSQSLAREFQPKGVHVAHAIIDGVIDTERARALTGNSSASAATGERIDPADIAKAYVWLSEQSPSAWTHELDLRPAREKW